MLTHSFEDLAQAFRVLIESYFKLNQLITVDRPEAVGTIETAINAILNAFHNLYDMMNKITPSAVDWYATPELCMILAIRNARHHNLANRIRSIYKYHAQICKNPTDIKEYAYIDFPAPPEEIGGDCFDLLISWGDIENLLSLTKKQSRLRNGTRELIRAYVNADKFESKTKSKGLSLDEIFINFVPLCLNAGVAILPFVKNYVKPDSVEAKHFLWHFEHVRPALTKIPEYNVLKFSLPK